MRKKLFFNYRFFYICFLLMLLSLLGCAQEHAGHTEGKHVFILSGQSNMAKLDPEKSFTPAVENEFGKKNIIIIKDATPGVCIVNWDRDWKTRGGQTLNRTGNLYNRLMVKIITATIDQPITSITFIWMQGECDAATAYTTDVYAKSLLDVYGQLQDDLGRKDINLVIGRISDYDIDNIKYKNWTRMREVQVKLAESNPRFSWVDTDNLNDSELDSDGKVEKSIHYTKAGYKTLGQRFAESAIKLIRENPN